MKVTLVEKGQPRFIIITADNPTSVIKDSVDELNYWIKKITRVELPVTTVSGWDGTTPYVAVGKSELTTRNGWDKEPFSQEEARVFIQDGRIGLLGNDIEPGSVSSHPDMTWRGTYYAVLELVKKSFGVRWIWPTELGEVFEPRNTLEIAVASWTWKTQLTLVRNIRNGVGSAGVTARASGYVHIEPDALEVIDNFSKEQAHWLKRQRMSNNISDVRFGHAFTDWWDRYGAEHPEWFAKPPAGQKLGRSSDTKLNLANPDVQNKIINDWKQAWQDNPEQHKVLNVSPNDARFFDTGPETRAWDAPELQRYSDAEIYNSPEPVLSDRYVKFWNILAQRIKEVDPEARLATYAYLNYLHPPLGDERVADNVIIGFVGGEGYYPDERFITDAWKGWKDRGAKLTWRPNVLFAGHGIPYLYSRILYDDFRFFHENGLLGTDFDSLTGNWAGQGLNYYILSELHSRPDATYEELVHEYFTAFGPAYDAIKRYHELFERRTSKMPRIMQEKKLSPRETWGGWWIAHIRIIPYFLTPEIASEAETLLQEAEKEVAGADSIYGERVKVVQDGYQHTKLMADAFRRLEIHNPDVTGTSGNVEEILRPLWDFRIAASKNFTMPVIKYIVEEERRLEIWSNFKPVKANVSGTRVGESSTHNQ